MAAFATCQCHFILSCSAFDAGSGSEAHQTQWTSALPSVENPAEIELHFADKHFMRYILNTILTMTWHIFRTYSTFVSFFFHFITVINLSELNMWYVKDLKMKIDKFSLFWWTLFLRLWLLLLFICFYLEIFCIWNKIYTILEA